MVGGNARWDTDVIFYRGYSSLCRKRWLMDGRYKLEGGGFEKARGI